METLTVTGLAEADEERLELVLEVDRVVVVLGKGVTVVNGPAVRAKYVTPAITRRITANANVKPAKSLIAPRPPWLLSRLRLFLPWNLRPSRSFAVGNTT
jgi:hypothetical protein